MTEEEREFIGFFMGEGTMYILKNKMKTTQGIRENYQPVIKIELRADDAKILYWIQKHFGGHIYHKTKYTNGRWIINQSGKKYWQNPTIGWKTSTRENCLYIISLLEQARLPSVKLRQVPVMKKLLEIKSRGHRNGFQGKWFTDQELHDQEQLRLEIKNLKLFS